MKILIGSYSLLGLVYVSAKALKAVHRRLGLFGLDSLRNHISLGAALYYRKEENQRFN